MIPISYPHPCPSHRSSCLVTMCPRPRSSPSGLLHHYLTLFARARTPRPCHTRTRPRCVHLHHKIRSGTHPRPHRSSPLRFLNYLTLCSRLGHTHTSPRRLLHNIPGLSTDAPAHSQPVLATLVPLEPAPGQHSFSTRTLSFAPVLAARSSAPASQSHSLVGCDLLKHIDQRIKLAARAAVRELLTTSMDGLN